MLHYGELNSTMDILEPFAPRKWQMRALASWSIGMQGIAKVVTGGGKTSFAMMCMEQYFSSNKQGRCVILVPSVALLDQWYVDIIDDTTLEHSEISVFGGGNKSQTYGKVSLMTLNTGREVCGKALREGDLLIVDECHRAASAENSRAITHDFDYYSLGLSATPERQYDSGFETELVPKLGPIIIDYDYIQAKRDGVICDFALFNVKVHMSDEEVEEYAILTRRIGKAMKNGGRESEEYLRLCFERAKKASQSMMRIPTAIDIVTTEKAEKTLIFHEGVQSAERISEILNKKGHFALTYHSKMSDAIRRDNLLKFKRGSCDVLVTCRALDEGANIPEASLGIIAASTKSDRQRIQRLGRVLRKAEGKEIANIYTIYSTDSEEENLIRESEQMSGLTEVKWLEARIS